MLEGVWWIKLPDQKHQQYTHQVDYFYVTDRMSCISLQNITTKLYHNCIKIIVSEEKLDNHYSTKPPITYSTLCLCSLNANQSEAEVGKSPNDWHLYRATPIPNTFPNIQTIFCKIA